MTNNITKHTMVMPDNLSYDERHKELQKVIDVKKKNLKRYFAGRAYNEEPSMFAIPEASKANIIFMGTYLRNKLGQNQGDAIAMYDILVNLAKDDELTDDEVFRFENALLYRYAKARNNK